MGVIDITVTTKQIKFPITEENADLVNEYLRENKDGVCIDRVVFVHRNDLPNMFKPIEYSSFQRDYVSKFDDPIGIVYMRDAEYYAKKGESDSNFWHDTTSDKIVTSVANAFDKFIAVVEEWKRDKLMKFKFPITKDNAEYVAGYINKERHVGGVMFSTNRGLNSFMHTNDTTRTTLKLNYPNLIGIVYIPNVSEYIDKCADSDFWGCSKMDNKSIQAVIDAFDKFVAEAAEYGIENEKIAAERKQRNDHINAISVDVPAYKVVFDKSGENTYIRFNNMNSEFREYMHEQVLINKDGTVMKFNKHADIYMSNDANIEKLTTDWINGLKREYLLKYLS